jgi:hypothetical protein
MPGEPMEETCNLFDDDCDGLLDEDAPCPDGEACVAGSCIPDDQVPGGDSGDDGSGSGSTGGDARAAAGSEKRGCRIGTPAGAGLLLLVSIGLRRRRDRGRRG